MPTIAAADATAVVEGLVPAKRLLADDGARLGRLAELELSGDVPAGVARRAASALGGLASARLAQVAADATGLPHGVLARLASVRGNGRTEMRTTAALLAAVAAVRTFDTGRMTAAARWASNFDLQLTRGAAATDVRAQRSRRRCAGRLAVPALPALLRPWPSPALRLSTRCP